MVRIGTVTSGTLERWDVSSALHSGETWRTELQVPFGEVASPRREPITGPPEDVRLGSIHFDGSVSIRASRQPIKGKLFNAEPGDVVFSKIDARNGAIAVVPEQHGPLAFTTEFPIFSLAETGTMLPEFAALVFRLPRFLALLQSRVVGHSGRKRLTPDQLEQVVVPLPPLEEQRLLAESYSQRLDQAVAAEAAAVEAHAATTDIALEKLGVIYQPTALPSGHFTAESSAADSWAVRSVRREAERRTGEITSAYPVVRLGAEGIGEVAYGVPKSQENRPGRYARPYLRVANVQAGGLDLREIKEIDVPPSAVERFLLRRGDLLLCEGNSEALVGRPALWNDDIPGCVHQNHVLRVRLDQSVLLPEFVMHYISSGPGRDYFLHRAKRTTNLASINSRDVAEFPCPAPPTALQRELVELWNHSADKRREAHADSVAAAPQALEEVEQALV